MKQISDTKDRIYNFIVSFTCEHLYPPTIREIADAVGLKSTSSVRPHLEHLASKGLIIIDKEYSSRAIKLTGYKLKRIE